MFRGPQFRACTVEDHKEKDEQGKGHGFRLAEQLGQEPFRFRSFCGMIHKTITPWDGLLVTLLTVNQVLLFMDHGMMQIHLDRLKESCESSKDNE